MSVKRVLIIVLVASAVMLAVGIGPQFNGTARALPPAQAGVTVPYSGSLTDEAGNPVADGAYAFTFALYAAESGGEPAWTEAQEDVTVQDGAFAALLGSVTPLPKEALDGGADWLEVAVRGPGEADFTALAPRQRLSAAASVAPAGLTAPGQLSCAHDHVGESWCTTTTGLTVDRLSACTGIALAYNGATLAGNSGNGLDAYSLVGDGVSGTTMVANKSGVYGNNSGDGYGVFGRSTNGFGMGANGNDASQWDRVGDLVLGGGLIGEIFAFGSDGLNLFSDEDVYIDLDDNNNIANACFKIYRGDNVVVGQTCEDGTKSAVLQTESYGQRLVYSVESPEVWLEDFGTASLVDGEATVAFESIFAEIVNLDVDYHVFMTPLCQEPVLLFVTAKTSTGFTVQGVTLDNQPSDCAFDYHVVAKRLGLEDLRLESVMQSIGPNGEPLR